MQSLKKPERNRYLGRVSVLFNSHSNTKNVSSEQAFQQPPKVVDRQCSKLEQNGEHMLPMFSSTHGLICNTSSFSALSHSSSPRAAALCNHHLPHCITHLPHKGQFSAVEMFLGSCLLSWTPHSGHGSH